MSEHEHAADGEAQRLTDAMVAALKDVVVPEGARIVAIVMLPEQGRAGMSAIGYGGDDGVSSMDDRQLVVDLLQIAQGLGQIADVGITVVPMPPGRGQG